MKKLTAFSAALIFIFALFAACANNKQINGSDNNAGPASYNIDEIPALHTKWPFIFGAAAPGGAFNAHNDQHGLLRHFEVLVAENDMKPDSILPLDGSGGYRWANADRLVNYAETNGVKIRGHVLIWHNQTPAWFFNGNGVEGRATKEQLYERMENQIKAVFEKYGGRIGWWDVVNEPVGDGGGPRPANSSKYTAIMTDSGYTGMDRYEYVLKAFQWARKYADANGGQNVKLYLNDYNIEYSGAKRLEFEKLLDWLVEKNAPIDGVGLQCHIKWDYPSVIQISNSIDRFSSKGFMTQVTELDISLFSNSESGMKILLPTMQDFRTRMQSEKYRQLFDMFREKFDEEKLDMVLVWGISDEYSWLNRQPVRDRIDYPLIFDRDCEPKAIYWELIK